MPEDALAYANHYINNDEVYFLISLSTNTTTVINDFGSFLSVNIYEYVAGEGKDASILQNGMLYGNTLSTKTKVKLKK